MPHIFLSPLFENRSNVSLFFQSVGTSPDHGDFSNMKESGLATTPASPLRTPPTRSQTLVAIHLHQMVLDLLFTSMVGPPSLPQLYIRCDATKIPTNSKHNPWAASVHGSRSTFHFSFHPETIWICKVVFPQVPRLKPSRLSLGAVLLLGQNADATIILKHLELQFVCNVFMNYLHQGIDMWLHGWC